MSSLGSQPLSVRRCVCKEPEGGRSGWCGQKWISLRRSPKLTCSDFQRWPQKKHRMPEIPSGAISDQFCLCGRTEPSLVQSPIACPCCEQGPSTMWNHSPQQIPAQVSLSQPTWHQGCPWRSSCPACSPDIGCRSWGQGPLCMSSSYGHPHRHISPANVHIQPHRGQRGSHSPSPGEAWQQQLSEDAQGEGIPTGSAQVAQHKWLVGGRLQSDARCYQWGKVQEDADWHKCHKKATEQSPQPCASSQMYHILL